MKRVCIGICMLLCIAACKKERLMGYEGGSSIYMDIDVLGGYFQSDTSVIDFSAYKGRQDTTLVLHFFTVGQIVHSKRPFKLAVSDSSTAVAGRDYIWPPADSFYIPADSNQTTIQLVMKRSPDLYDQSRTLILKLQPNDYFGANVTEITPTNDYPRSVVRLRITISNTLVKPDIWNANQHVLGTYSRKKLTLMVQVLSLTLDRFFNNPYSSVQLETFAREFQAYLNQQRVAGNVVMDENDTPMVMGPDVQ